MAFIFITGSTDGLGRAAAQSLIGDGHRVVLHARSADRAASIGELASRASGVAVGDLRSAADVRSIADQVNAIGRTDAIIHNAGIYTEGSRGSTPEGHAGVLAINALAPYILAALIQRPDRLVYLSSGLHRSGEGSLDDLDWKKRSWGPAKAYAESKLHVVALAFALARRWPQVLSNAVDSGWARTKMGGPGAPVDLDTGQRTQTWLAVSEEPAAMVSGRYWHHLRQEQPVSETADPKFQDRLIVRLGELTGVALP
ncbi:MULTISPECIES: SDR family NAD(P)-dependent oxidoreductase [unclassified Bradyrhizobium]|uniref:SDR family NAD(P)-dependent oxidoreductase n=1 Tax=unclassified Bradyrhizobium TaxID=2631580 RepID=UPI00247957CC|nr:MULTISPECIES: SDR family NAD(P)-dependent oxidoreductase [unclassified Bradyrhizobium]WGR70511.1 SDR family NAD(P)-dependent oxidoreductase [Bradyrhizobium sp. ISRA426]WGR82567.1 SDR family NAD(P)-dependent oxidoreductase [Bradyrhizobium sp. ISRA430]WGR85754.1 SDR family NAD(P)-dependent oxidoreductase [Bradyrhizobium sp. ISRA432]